MVIMGERLRQRELTKLLAVDAHTFDTAGGDEPLLVERVAARVLVMRRRHSHSLPGDPIHTILEVDDRVAAGRRAGGRRAWNVGCEARPRRKEEGAVEIETRLGARGDNDPLEQRVVLPREQAAFGGAGRAVFAVQCQDDLAGEATGWRARFDHSINLHSEQVHLDAGTRSRIIEDDARGPRNRDLAIRSGGTAREKARGDEESSINWQGYVRAICA